MMATRNQSVRYWDNKSAHRLRDPLQPGELVLAYNKSLESQWGKLFSNRWNGPYEVVEQHKGVSYTVKELDGKVLKRRFAASHNKRFYPRGRLIIQQEEH